MIANRRRHYSQEDVVKIDDYPTRIRIDCYNAEEYKWEMGYFAGDVLSRPMIIDGTTTTYEGQYYGPYKTLSAGHHVIYLIPLSGETGSYQTLSLPKGTTYIRLPYNITTKWSGITSTSIIKSFDFPKSSVVIDILDPNVVRDVYYTEKNVRAYSLINVPKGSKAKYIEYKNESAVINLIKEVKFEYTKV